MTLLQFRDQNPGLVVEQTATPPYNRGCTIETLCATIGGHPHLNRRVLFQPRPDGKAMVYALIETMDSLVSLGVVPLVVTPLAYLYSEIESEEER